MKKLIMFLLILIILNLCSCCEISNDGSIIHNGTKYDSILISGFYNFIGPRHKTGYVKFKTFEKVYCLDSDTDENIIFNENHALTYIWVKQGFDFPNKDTFMDKFYFKKYYEDNYEMNIEIENCFFNNLFVEVEISNFEDLNSVGLIYFLYYENIEYSTFVHSDDFGNFYIEVFDYNNKKRHHFKVFNETLIDFLKLQINI